MSLKSSSGSAGRCSTVSRARSPRRTPRKRSRVSARRKRSWTRVGPSRGSPLRCPGGSSGLPRPTGGRSRTRWVPVSTKRAAEDVLIDVSRAEPLRGGKTLHLCSQEQRIVSEFRSLHPSSGPKVRNRAKICDRANSPDPPKPTPGRFVLQLLGGVWTSAQEIDLYERRPAAARAGLAARAWQSYEPKGYALLL